MRASVNAVSHTAYNNYATLRELIGCPIGDILAILRTVTRTDNRDGFNTLLWQLTLAP